MSTIDLNGPPSPTVQNARAAALARIAIEVYAAAAGLDLSPDGEGLETAISDLLSDLRHLCDIEEIGYEDADATARADYSSEYGDARRERRAGLVTEPVTPKQVAALATQLRPITRLFIACDDADASEVRAFGATAPVELHVHYNRDGSVDTPAVPVVSHEAFASELTSYTTIGQVEGAGIGQAEDIGPRLLTESDRQDVTSELSQLAPGQSVGFVNEAIATRSQDGSSFTVEGGRLNGEAEPTRAELTLEQAVDAVLRAAL